MLLAWRLDPTKGNMYRSLTESISNIKRVEKKERWIGSMEAASKWTQPEIEAHVWSGRLSERECPQTPGVWEYRDNFDLTFKHEVEKSKVVGGKQKIAMDDDEEHHDDWETLFNGIDVSLNDRALKLADALERPTPAKGKGKGKLTDSGGLTIELLKGKGKGKRHGKDDRVLPDPKITDPTEAAVSKAKQAIMLMEKTIMALEEDMANVARSKYMNPKLKAAFMAYVAKLQTAKNKVKTNMAKVKDLDLESFKTIVQGGVAVVK